MYIIEKNIPIPPKPGFASRPQISKYPWNDMNPGDSILIEDRTARQIASTVAKRAKSYNEKYTVRSVGKGCRVWKLK